MSLAPTTPETNDLRAIDWDLIRPRPRGAFWNICIFVLGRDGHDKRPGYLAPAITERQTPGWRLILPDSKDDDKVIGAASIRPLANLSLLAADKNCPDRLVISEIGEMTWHQFCSRGGRFPDDFARS